MTSATEYLQTLNSKYPCWDKKTKCINEDVSPNERAHRIICEGDIHLNDIYDIPIYQMNMAALNNDWDAFMFMLEYHGLEISPAALFIAHCFQKFDISNKIIEMFDFEDMIKLTHAYHKKTHWSKKPIHYIWCGGIYENPLLYQMYVHKYEKRHECLKSWWDTNGDGSTRSLDETNCGGWNSTYVGFLHPEMKDTLHIKHLDRYYGDTQVFPYHFKHDRANALKYIDNSGGKFELHDITRFYCITPELVDIQKEYGDRFYHHTFHAYWFRESEYLQSRYSSYQPRRLEPSILLNLKSWNQENLDNFQPTMIF